MREGLSRYPGIEFYIAIGGSKSRHTDSSMKERTDETNYGAGLGIDS